MSRSKKRLPFSVPCDDGKRIIVMARHAKGAKSVAEDHGYTVQARQQVLGCAEGAEKHAINAGGDGGE